MSDQPSFNQVLEKELEQIKKRRELVGDPDIAPQPPVAEDGNAVERAEKSQLCGLAFSGGGIRSATFNLGVLQALSKAGLLRRFDYLSTNSGGGYIGSWFSAWIHRTHIKTVEEQLGKHRATAKAAQQETVEPTPVSFLREFSNYLTPKVGLFTADTWTMVSTYLRNMLLNLVILVAALAALLLLPRALVFAASKFPDSQAFYALIASAVFVLIALWFVGRNIAKLYAAEPPRYASQGAVQWLVVVPLFIGALLASAGLWYSHVDKWKWLGEPGPIQQVIGEFGKFSGGVWLWGLTAASIYLLAWLALFLLSVVRRLFLGGTRRRTGRGPRYYWLALLLSSPVAGFVGGVLLWSIFELAKKAFGSIGDDWTIAYVTLWGAPLIAVSFCIVGVVHIGLIGRQFTEFERQWWSRLGAWLLIYSALWLFLFSIALYGPILVIWVGALIAASLSVAWLVSTVTGVLVGKRAAPDNGEKAGLGRRLVLSLAPAVFIVGLLLALSFGLHGAFNKIDSKRIDKLPPQCAEFWPGDDEEKRQLMVVFHCHSERMWASNTVKIPIAMGLLLLLACILAWRVDINAFSLHLFYRSRLLRAYLGASNPAPAPQPFTGFDVGDDVELARLCAIPAEGEAHTGPYPILNTALNLVGGEKLAWQERKAASFAFTPLHCGFRMVGIEEQKSGHDSLFLHAHQATPDYVAPGITLGTAMAISGAAASPNMGYRTSPTLAFLLTVFNVRLGWWLGNPRHKKTHKRISPVFGLRPLLSELFGMTNSRSKYVYLSDGGHFENLALYELVKRRCRFIVQTDVGADPDMSFEDIGNAIRKCRTDLGVEIDLDLSQLKPEAGSRYSHSHCVVGTVYYDPSDPDGARGTILYIKSSLTGDEPEDVQNYAAEHPAFPHESTADQWFAESQFESYRSLGEHIATGALQATGIKNLSGTGLQNLFVRLRQSWYPPSMSVSQSFTQHTKTLDELFVRLADEDKLTFLDEQIYPEWKKLRKSPPSNAPVEGPPLPDSDEERRAGFYFCNSLIQLMENVYVDLRLEQESEHPDNRGWMNLFKHWSWSPMFRATWAICAATYGVRFQSFCRRMFSLELGKVDVKSLAIDIDGLLAGPPEDLETVTPLNFLEARFVHGFVDKNRSRIGNIHALTLGVQDNRDSLAGTDDAIVEFCFGFAVTDTKNRLLYLRVQDHLRKMGLARAALKVLVARKIREVAPKLAQEHFPVAVRERAGELQIAALRRLMDSVSRNFGQSDGTTERES